VPYVFILLFIIPAYKQEVECPEYVYSPLTDW